MKRPEISPEVDSLLENCDFALGTEPSGLLMLPSSNELEAIGGDGMGGVFYLWHAAAVDDEAPVVYLSAYGETTRFADSFNDALRIVAAYPTAWRDLLVSAHKSEALFHDVLNQYRDEADPDDAQTRERLVSALNLDLANIDTDFLAGVRRDPPFVPMLDTEDGNYPGESFGSRPYPA